MCNKLYRLIYVLKLHVSQQLLKVIVGFPVSVVYLFTCISRFNATIDNLHVRLIFYLGKKK
jgi:hypothetical protein